MLVRIEETLESCFKFLQKLKELQEHEPSILEIGRALGWNYPKTNNIAKALEKMGFIELELYTGLPRKFVVRLTKKGECLLNCFSEIK